MSSRAALQYGLCLLAVASFYAHAGTLEIAVHDAAGAAVADAAVYAVAVNGGGEARNRSAEITQVDREFVPFVTVIQVGTTVAFPNRDPIMHHVYSFSPAKPFEIKLYTGKSPQEVVFDKPGVVVLGCNIHDWMLAYVAVVPTPYFGRTDASGVVVMPELPAGAYDVHAWHPLQRAALPPFAVTVPASGGVQARFSFDLAPRKAKFKPALDRMKY
jgi:plastocyanin